MVDHGLYRKAVVRSWSGSSKEGKSRDLDMYVCSGQGNELGRWETVV